MNGIVIWTSASHHAAFRCGGWAYVRAGGEGITGAAGGERDTTVARMARAGLAAALGGLPASSLAEHLISVHTTSADLRALIEDVLSFPSVESKDSAAADLRSKLLALARARRLSVLRDPPPAGTSSPSGFVAAWAELARDKAKLGGAFTSPIPKSNLAKAPGLGSPGLGAPGPGKGVLTKA